MRLEIELDREPDGGRWIAEVSALPGCVASGESEGEALNAVQALALRRLAERLEHERPAPEPLELAFHVRRTAHAPPTASAPAPPLDGARALARMRVEPRALAAACEEFEVAELALFGSALRPDFALDSDIDVLVTFLDGAEPDLLDLAGLQIRLAELFRRRVDVALRDGLKPEVAPGVLAAAEVIFAAGRGVSPGHRPGG